MPKLREYVQGPNHDTSISNLKPADSVPRPGSQDSRGQPVNLNFDATSGQQTRQVRSLMWHIVEVNSQ